MRGEEHNVLFVVGSVIGIVCIWVCGCMCVCVFGGVWAFKLVSVAQPLFS